MGRTVAIIQARMSSTRLPGKVLAEIGETTALELMISRIQKAKLLDDIIVATTLNEIDNSIVKVSHSIGIKVFRGDEQDVLGRMLLAAEEASAAKVVRLTADCPIHDASVIDSAIQKMDSGNWDYVSNVVNRTFPDGLDTEIMTIDALQEANDKAIHAQLREHVTLYINSRNTQLESGNFRKAELLFKANFSHIRWTLDTKDDLKRLRELVSNLPSDFTWLEALSVATQKPHLLGVT